MLQKLQHTAQRHRLLEDARTVLLGVSGGADSMALSIALQELRQEFGIDLAIAHLDHGIRREAGDDAAFVEAHAKSLDVPFVSGRVDVPRLANEQGISLEMAAREARYDFFKASLEETRADCVATAHTADDQAETVLLRLCRGAGAQGLAGIGYTTDWQGMHVIRPLLDVTRDQVIKYLTQRGVDWCEDETNKDIRFLRNRVRHEIMPVLSDKLNPRIRQALCRTAQLMREENEWIESLTADLLDALQVGDRGCMQAEALHALPVGARRRVLRGWLNRRGVDPAAVDYDALRRIEDLIEHAEGTSKTDLSGPWSVIQRYGELDVMASEACPESFRVRLNVPGETLMSEQGLHIVSAWSKGVVKGTRATPGELPSTASFEAEALGEEGVFVRSWMPGDRIEPMGMSGSKKLQDLFVDHKVSKDRRSQVPVFECRGEVVWVPGYSVARGWEVKSSDSPSLHVRIERL